MSRLTSRPPKLCHHKGQDQAMVYVNGKQRYLGRYGSPEAKAAYKAFVAEWATGNAQPTPVPADVVPIVAPTRVTIAEAAQQYRNHAERYYQSREVDNLGEAIKPLRIKFGFMPMADFGPLQLRVLRNQWIEQNLARNTINARIIRLKRFFRWACSYELIETKVLDRLNTVESLMPGRGGKETKAKLPVSWETVEMTLPFLPEMVRAMVLLIWHTGARPAEVTKLTTGEIDQRGEVWIARLEKHKTAGYGHTREIPIGRTAQNALTPWLRPEAPDEPIFSPLRVDDRQAKRKGKRLPGRAYSRAAFQQVVRRACKRAGIEPAWSPNMLRHAFGGRIREAGGLEAAQMALGHAKPDTTLIYTTAAKARMMDTVREMG
jgi:integrase